MFHPDWLGADPTSDPQLALRFLFHDCDPQDQQWALGTLRPFNPGPTVYQHSPAALPARNSRAAVVPDADYEPATGAPLSCSAPRRLTLQLQLVLSCQGATVNVMPRLWPNQRVPRT